MNTMRAATEEYGRAARPRRQRGATARAQFLRRSGFQRDVFALQVAEQEYALASRPDAISAPDREKWELAAAEDHHQRERRLRQLFPSLYPMTDDGRNVEKRASRNGQTGHTAAAESAANALPGPIDWPAETSFSPRAFFVDPVYAGRAQGSIFSDLRRSQSTLVFGRPGEGKTTTRLALEAHVRTQPERTLIVTYEPGKADSTPTLDDHLTRLVEQVAVDLFVQVVEQFAYRTRAPNARQTAGMAWLALFGGQPLDRVRDVLTRGQEPSAVWGFAELWRYLDRPIVRSVVRTERLRRWLSRLNACIAADAAPPLPPPERWQKAVGIVRSWGYRQIYVAIDGVDTWQRTPPAMMAVLDALLAETPHLARQRVYLKSFLPLELRPEVENKLAAAGLGAADCRLLTLNWERDRLEALIDARFRAAGSGRRRVGDLALTEAGDDIDALLIATADHSPRRLLTQLDQLLNVHLRRGEPDRPITAAEWQEAARITTQLLGEPSGAAGEAA